MVRIEIVAIVDKRRYFVRSHAHSCVIWLGGASWRRVRRNKRGGYYYHWWGRNIKINSLRVKAPSRQVTTGGNHGR